MAEVYEEATFGRFQGTILVGGIVALFGAVIAFWLPKKKIDPEGVRASSRRGTRPWPRGFSASVAGSRRVVRRGG